LFGPGPKRILSLDGGGVRGAISVAFLGRIEALLEERLDTKVRLGDCWPTGPDQLSIASIGTGTYRPIFAYEEEGVGRFAKLAYYALMSLMTDAETFTLAQMQWMESA
jgi:hypothetical protein